MSLENVFTSSLHYRDPKAALAWLERAFGFEITMAIDGPPEAPEMCHYEMSSAGRGRIMIGAEWAEWVRSPAERRRGEHPDRARAARRRASTSTASGPGPPGPMIVAEPEDQFYGDRTYRAVDLEGPPVDVLDARARRHPGRGRGGDRPADHGHRLAVSAPAAPLDETLAALADPVRRRAVELLAERPAPGRRAGRRAGHHAVGDEQAPAGAAPERARRPRPTPSSTPGSGSTRCARRRWPSCGPGSTPPSGAGRSSSPPSPSTSSVTAVTDASRGARGAAGAPPPPSGPSPPSPSEIGQWWRPNGLFQFTEGRTGTLAFEPGPERAAGRDLRRRRRRSSIGHVRVWEPPHRLVVSWRQASFADDQETELHVRFEDVDAPAARPASPSSTSAGTRIPAEHAARHGFPLASFQLRFAEWWQELLAGIAEHV